MNDYQPSLTVTLFLGQKPKKTKQTKKTLCYKHYYKKHRTVHQASKLKVNSSFCTKDGFFSIVSSAKGQDKKIMRYKSVLRNFKKLADKNLTWTSDFPLLLSIYYEDERFHTI